VRLPWPREPLGGSQDVVTVVFVAQFRDERVSECVRAGRFDLRMPQFVDLGRRQRTARPARQSVTRSLVDGDVIPDVTALELLLGLVHPVVDERIDTSATIL